MNREQAKADYEIAEARATLACAESRALHLRLRRGETTIEEFGASMDRVIAARREACEAMCAFDRVALTWATAEYACRTGEVPDESGLPPDVLDAVRALTDALGRSP